jgi:hypothetical protein
MERIKKKMNNALVQTRTNILEYSSLNFHFCCW